MEQAPQAGLTRRSFLDRVGRVGGVGALYGVMQAMGLAATPTHAAEAPGLASGRGHSVLILGAGVAGMTAAYELTRAGYSCRILEARRRSGGRCWTLREGDQVVEVEGPRQRVRFAQGLYFNPGPARIPHHHRALLGYCKRFGIELEVFSNANRAAYFHTASAGPLASRRVPHREALADVHGYTAELLAKAVNQRALDDRLDADDKERLLEYLSGFGGLTADYRYVGFDHRGYSEPPGAGDQPGVIEKPHELGALLESGFWRDFSFELGYEQQAVMLHPVGGMDRIAAAFEQRVRRWIDFECQVQEIRRTPQGVRVVYYDARAGELRERRASYCICTVPLPVLRDIPADFEPEVSAAIAGIPYSNTVKVGLEFRRRFWEDDEGIYGGMSWTDQNIRQIWYPATRYHDPRGVITGAYNFDQPAFELGLQSGPERVERALREGSAIHSQYRREFASGVSVAWQNVPYQLGGWGDYTPELRATHYRTLIEADGPIFFAGEHMSYLPGWQEGAVVSAHAVLERIGARMQSLSLTAP